MNYTVALHLFCALHGCTLIFLNQLEHFQPNENIFKHCKSLSKSELL